MTNPPAPWRMKLTVALAFTAMLSSVTGVTLTAGVVQAATRRTFYVELQNRLELNMRQVRAGQELPSQDVQYTMWRTPLPERGSLVLRPPTGMDIMPKWSLTPSQVNRLRRGEAIFTTQGPDSNPQRVLLAPTRTDQIEATYTSIRQINTTLETLKNVQVIVVLTVLLLTMAISNVITQYLMQPLRAIGNAMRNLNPRAPGPPSELPNTTGEFQDLVLAYNAMARRTRAVIDTQDNFIRDAGHELRTPLTSMIGHAGFLLRRTPVTEAQRESLTVIREEGERMGRLLTDLLSLSRASNAEHREPTTLRPLIEKVILNLTTTTLARVAITFQGPDATVHANPDQLKQVFSNLMNNAAQAHATTIDVTLHLNPEQRNVTVSVTDNGSGISRQNLEKIFERFYRTNDSRDRNTGGNGLGLTITRNILLVHGGDIHVDSHLGVGTRFTVTLPTANPDPNAPVT